MKRRLFLATGASALLAGCSAIGTKLNDSKGFHAVLDSAEQVSERIIGTRGMARLYTAKDISATFPIDSLPTPQDSHYQSLENDGFRGYRLAVDGEVDHPQSFSLAHLVHLMNVSQITRHDCVEGWSVVAQWEGVRLADLLSIARPTQRARYVVFHSYDSDDNGTPYYESLDLQQAAHPQTLLALRQNGAPITADRGAPVRLTIPTQLGYKSAKWVHRIEAVASLKPFFGGKGGYWEDQGYEWYAGI